MASDDEVNSELPLPAPFYKVHRRRFYVLFIFAFLAFNQCLFWLTFSSIATSTEKHYDVSESTMDLLLAWGPIFFIPCLPLAYLLLNKRNGLRYCVIILAITDLVATSIRIVPLILISASNPRFNSISLPFLHAGQILNAACGPLAMAPVSQLSCLWFGPNERTRATTVAIMAYNLGSTTGFLLGPAVVYSPEHVPRLLYIHVALAFAAFILAILYFPGLPPTPPSPAAEFLLLHPISEENTRSWRAYTTNLRRCFTTPSFVLLVIAGGLIGGTFEAWTSLFDTILTHENYTEKQSGWFGFSSSLAEIIGGLCFAAVADMPRFHRSLKIMIVISYVCYFLSVGWFNLSIHTLFYDQPVLPSSAITIAFSVTLAGLFQGAASPLTYEALAEFMYPLPESLSASVLVEFINITSLTLFFIAPNRHKLMNLVVLIAIAVCILLASFTRFIYRRRDAEHRRFTTISEANPIYNLTQMGLLPNSSTVNPVADSIQMDPILDSTLVKLST